MSGSPSRPASKTSHTDLERAGARVLARGIVAIVRDALVVLAGELRVVMANGAFCAAFGITPDEAEGRHFFVLGDSYWEFPALRQLLTDIRRDDHALIEKLEITHDRAPIGRRERVVSARRVRLVQDGDELILLAIEDVTAAGAPDRVRGARAQTSRGDER